MSENAITRRSFLAGTAGVATLAATAGCVGFGSWEQAQAADTVEGGETKAVHSLCNSCSSKCGFTGYVRDGRLGTMIGDPNHPYCEGTLCARGYAYASIAYSEDRLTDPLKKNDKGEFEPISWEQAYSEIAEKVRSIVSESGPQALAMIQDPRPSGSYYTKRFMNALGSANVYTHGVACNMSKNSGMTQAIGASDFTADVANAKMVMFIGRSYADGIRPSSLHALQKAHERGCHVVVVDPRCNNSTLFADEWLPINPGTDLALILGMAHVLVEEGKYDKDYVAECTVGFEDWAARLVEYTPEWAAEKTGIAAETIKRLANEMWNAAPAASIEQSWRAAFGCSYQNSGETARALCLFNTLLGCWGVEGGAYFPASQSAGKISDPRFAAPAAPKDEILGQAEYPLSLSGMGVSLHALQLIPEGGVKGVFFYQSNCVAGYSNPATLSEYVGAAELSVAIDVQMTETCQACQYVLPDTSYLERLEVPEFVGGKVPVVSLRDQVIEKVHPNTRPVDQIFTELAEACGVGEYFQFTVEELADEQLKTVGLSLEALRKAGGTVAFPEKALEFGQKKTWKTPAGKVQFTSEACEKAGLPASPGWLDPMVMPSEGHFRLIGGKQAIHTHTQTANIEGLMEITKQYGLDRVWMNEDVAAQMGISDDDEIELSSSTFTGRTRVHTTPRINPTAIFLPSHYGCSVKEQKTAYGVGLRQMDFVPFHIEPAYGGAMTQETVVTVKKVGA